MGGHSYRFNYAKRFASNTTLNLAGYRFSSRNFRSLNNYIDLKRGYSSDKIWLEKNKISISVSQYVPEWDISFSGSLNSGSYWNQKKNTSYNLVMSKTFREGYWQGVSMSLSLAQDLSNINYIKDTRIGFYVSIPLNYDKPSNETGLRSVQYSSQYSAYDRRIDQTAMLNGSTSSGRYNFGVQTYHANKFSNDFDYSLTGNYMTRTGYGEAMLSGTYSKKRQTLRADYNGSITITQHGIATHNRIYGDLGARLILDAGTSGVEMEHNDNRSNIFGLLGVDNVTSYFRSVHRVNNDDLPKDVEVQDGVVSVALSDGAIGFSSLGTIYGEKAVAIITLTDGSHPPFGAAVYRENGDNQEVAIIAESGLTYLTGLNNHSKFIVKWGKSNSCQINIKTIDSLNVNNFTCD